MSAMPGPELSAIVCQPRGVVDELAAAVHELNLRRSDAGAFDGIAILVVHVANDRAVLRQGDVDVIARLPIVNGDERSGIVRVTFAICRTHIAALRHAHPVVACRDPGELIVSLFVRGREHLRGPRRRHQPQIGARNRTPVVSEHAAADRGGAGRRRRSRDNPLRLLEG
jgi:hypothetical protein